MELRLLLVERTHLRWFEHLIRTTPFKGVKAVFLLKKKKKRGKTQDSTERLDIYPQVWERLRVPQEDLERDAWDSLLDQSIHWMHVYNRLPSGADRCYSQ